MPQADARKGPSPAAKLLVGYLAFVLYLYLADWLAYLNLVTLPLSGLPAPLLLTLVLLGVVGVTMFNSKWRGRKSMGNKPA